MKPLRIAQISDFHFTSSTLNPFRLFSKRFLGLLNWHFFRKDRFSTDSIHALPQLLNSLSLDLILLGGDFTSTALPREYEQALQLVEKLKPPWVAVPGNHDHYTRRAHRLKRFYRYLSRSPRKVASKIDFFRMSEHGIEAHALKDGWWVVALDTARATNLYSSRGLFSKDLERRTKEVLQLIPADHSILLLTHYPLMQNDSPRRSLSRSEALEELIKSDKRIKAFLHGHTHRRTIADLQDSGLPLILDSGCSADAKKGSFHVLEIDHRGATIDIYRWNGKWQLSGQQKIVWKR